MNGWRTLFPNGWFIAIREYRSRVGGRSFILGTLLLAVLAFAVAQLPVLIDYLQGTSTTKVAVVVSATDTPPDALQTLDYALNPGAVADPASHKEFVLSWLPGADPAAVRQDVRDGKYGAELIVDRDAATHDLTFSLRTDMPSDSRQVSMIATAAQTLEVADRLAKAGTSTAAILAPAAWEVLPANASAAAQTTNVSEEISSSLISTGLIVLIFMAIITYGTWVAMSVAEEKGSRVMELMLNATTPLQMLAGKVIGNGAAGLTQYGAVIAAVVVGLLAQDRIRVVVLGSSSQGTPFGGLNAPVFAAFVVLFLLGFLLYALLYAALGSLVSRQEDVQSATSPLMMLIMLGYFLSVFGIQAVNEPWVVGLSFVPFFSPYLMLARVAMGHVELWEFGLTMLIMLATSALALFIAARIYSAGVLLYGQRVGLRQVFSAARVSR